MKNEDIITRLPHARYEMKGTLNDVEAMTDELASCPPGNDRANQIKQQVHSKLGDVRRVMDDLQPEPQEEKLVTADVEDSGASFAQNPDHQRRPDGLNDSVGSTDVTGSSSETFNGSGRLDLDQGSGHKDGADAHEVVEMEKKIKGNWLTVTVWVTSAEHLEEDGWSKVGEPRPVEDGEEPIEAEEDKTDHENG